MDPISSFFQSPYQPEEDKAPPLSLFSQKIGRPWTEEEDTILEQILKNPPEREGTSNFNWIEITKFYNEATTIYNKTIANTQRGLVNLPQRNIGSVRAHYHFLKTKVQKYIQEKDLPKVDPISSSSQKKRRQWTNEEKEILKQICQDPPQTEGTLNFDWSKITKIYNEAIAIYNETIANPQGLVNLPQRYAKSLREHYRSNIKKVHKCIQEKDLPKIVETIREVYLDSTKFFDSTKFPSTTISLCLVDKEIYYTAEQIRNLLKNAKNLLLQDHPPLEDILVEDILEKILEYKEKKTKKKAISEESLKKPPKRIKRSVTTSQDHSTATTSAPQSISMDRPLSIDTKPLDTQLFCTVSPVHAAHPFTEAINSQLSPTSQTSATFQFPLDPLQEDLKPESLDLLDSEKEFLSLPLE